VAAACAALATGLPSPSLKRVAPELMHLTLAFVGNVPETTVAPATAALETLAASGAIAARLGDPGAFPTPTRPRVVWVGLAEGADAVRDRAVHLRAALVAGQVPFDDAPPVAHLTVARVRDDVTAQDRRALAEAVRAATIQPLAFRIDEARLYESRLSPKGPTYRPLASVTL